MQQPAPYVSMADADLDLSDWVIIDKEHWWHTDILACGLPPASFFTPSSSKIIQSNAPESDAHNVELASDLPGVLFAEQVLRFYEHAVGFHKGRSLDPVPFTLAEAPFPPESTVAETDRINTAVWHDKVALMDDDDDSLSSSMSSSMTTQRSTSVDMTSDSERSAAFSSMPTTPKAADHPVLIKDASWSSSSESSPLPRARSSALEADLRVTSSVTDFKFPTLDSPTVEITRDEDGFIFPLPEAQRESDPISDLLPPFLLDAAPKSKASTKSKTRTMVDKLRSSSRDHSDDGGDDEPTPSIHDLSFIKPRLDTPSDGDDDDGGWIGSPLNSDPSQGDSLMTLANRARNAFVQGLKRSKVAVAASQPSKINKGKARAGVLQDEHVRSRSVSGPANPVLGPTLDKDGWIEFPSLNSGRAKLSSTKDTVPRRSPSKRAPGNNGGQNVNHRRSASHQPLKPPLPISGSQPLITSGTVIFPPPPRGIQQQQQQWPGGPLPMALPPFAAPAPFYHQRAPSMPMLRPPPPPHAGPMSPGPGGWFFPNPVVPPPMMRHPAANIHPSHHRRLPSAHVI